MNQRTWMPLLAVALLMVLPAEALAQAGFIRYLDKLSGPGPFKGVGYEVGVLCYGVKKDSPSEEDPPRDSSSGAAASRLFADLGCAHAARNRIRATAGIEWGFLTADENPLAYLGVLLRPGGPESRSFTLAGPPEVGLFTFAGTVDVGLRQWLDAGLGFGFHRYSGDVFQSFSRPVVEARATVKPLSFFGRTAKERYVLEFLQFRYGLTALLDGFEPSDFGAVGGSLPGGGEVLESRYYLVVNLGNLLNR